MTLIGSNWFLNILKSYDIAVTIFINIHNTSCAHTTGMDECPGQSA